MAETAFSNIMVGCVQSMGHATGVMAHIPYGLVMSIFLPVGLAFNMSKCEDRIGELLLPLAGADVQTVTPPAQRAAKTIEEVKCPKNDLFDLCGLPRTLKEAGVDMQLKEAVAALAVNDGSTLMNPREITLDTAWGMFDQAYE